MANESLIVATDNQVDLNNNDEKASKAGAKSDANGDRHLNSSTGTASSPTDESDDLVLRLKAIILQQEQEEKARLNEKPNNCESNDDKRSNGSKSSSLERARVRVSESPKFVRAQLNGNKSPKSDKRSISQIKKSPVPSRKMINQTTSEINGKLTNGRSTNNEVNQTLVKETLQKISDLAIDKVSQNDHLNGNANGNLNGSVNDSPNGGLINGHTSGNSEVKISVNGEFLIKLLKLVYFQKCFVLLQNFEKASN